MKMVASAKLHRAQGAIESMLPYQKKINHILTNFLSAMDTSLPNPYTADREVKSVAILVFSSNSSLCGAFNANIIKYFVEVTNRYKHLPKENILVYPVGRKIEEAAKKMGFILQGSYQDIAGKPSYEKAAKLAEEIEEAYLSGKVDRVEMIYQHFRTVSTQELQNSVYLPIDMECVKKEAKQNSNGDSERKLLIDYIIEPSFEEFVYSLLPTVLKFKVFALILDSNAAEHAARTMAMQVASDNANDLIQDLTKQYNKSRQQAITNELLDIIGGGMK